MSFLSFNEHLVCEPYTKGKQMDAKVNSGFAMIEQKNTLYGLKVLVPCKMPDGTHVPAGSTAYFLEEVLYSQQWSRNKLSCDSLDKECILAEKKQVVLIKFEDTDVVHFPDAQGSFEGVYVVPSGNK